MYIFSGIKSLIKIFQNRIFVLLILFMTFSCSTSPALISFAQVEGAAPANIALSITKVVKDGRDIATEKTSGNNYVLNDSLGNEDSIKYSWNNARILTSFKDKPALCCGFINAYLEDETNENNFLFTTGSDDYPLKISKFSDKLKSGKNTLILVFFNHTNKATDNKSTLTFDYIISPTQQTTVKPTINVIKPGVGAVFSKEVTQNIVLEIENFTLSKDIDNKSPNIGKLNIYGNDKANLLDTIDAGISIAPNKIKVEFKPETIPKFEKLPDSKNTKLLFELVSQAQEEPVLKSSFDIITNFNKSTDLGLPAIKITDPVKDSGNTVITEDKVFLIDYQNFTVLEKEPTQSTSSPSNKEGFVQIFVNNNPIATKWAKKQFTLKELGFVSQENGEKEIKVQLVNANYEKLSPDVSDKVKVQFNSNLAANTKVLETETQTSNWKIIIIILTIILIVGGILISITKS